MATAATTSPWKTPSHSHSNSRSSRPLTTPRPNHAIATSTTGVLSPRTPGMRSPRNKDATSASPSYFGLVVGEDSIPGESGPGPHTRQNWIDPTKSSSKNSGDRSPDFELFRRQSERNITFSLNSLPQSSHEVSSSHQSPISPQSTAFPQSYIPRDGADRGTRSPGQSFFPGVQQQGSPASLTPQATASDMRNMRLSLPAHEIQDAIEGLQKAQRSDTVPPQPTKEVTAMVSPSDVAKVLDQSPDNALILDLRVYPQYAASRVRGALNLCIPTTLLKRPAFTVQKLAETFTSEQDRAKFDKWRTAQYIVVYDAASSLAKEAITSFHVLKKFMSEGWKGSGLVVKGGFAGFSKLAPSHVDRSNKAAAQQDVGQVTSGSPSSPPKLPVAGGCQMPATKNAANPFFGNIRQNMDLLDGVGQMPINRPSAMQSGEEKRLPAWLKRAISISNEGKEVSNKFLGIERTEQSRMQQALSGSVSYGTPGPNKKSEVQVAGIEKGSKNRYNNIFPFEHSRVKLQNVPSHGCDYVNASYVKARHSNRKYIATQAPIPQTFDDFWRVIWEQEVRVIVMLTAEAEGGQVKSHPYWQTGVYGNVQVKLTREQKVLLNSAPGQSGAPQKRPGTSRRLTTTAATPQVEKKFNFEPTQVKPGMPKIDEEPAVVVRCFAIAHASARQPREIVQIQYTQWPDFGAPASPTAILSLISLVDKFQRDAASPKTTNAATEPANAGQKPIVVHCSAGCGRTGTFCTVDSVIDMLKRQKMERLANDRMDVDNTDDWIDRDDVDLIAQAVEDFRLQRLSMVQNLRQFVLCYESILQWYHENR